MESDLLVEARTAVDRGHFEEALKLCTRVLKEDPGSYDALVIAGHAAYGMREYDNALKGYRKALDVMAKMHEEGVGWAEKRDDGYDAWEGVLRIAIQKEDAALEVESLEHMLQIIPEEDARDAGLRVRLALKYAKTGEYTKSIQQYGHVLESLPVGSRERLELLCEMADVMLKHDEISAENEVEEKLKIDDSQRSISCIKLDVMAAHAATDETTEAHTSLNNVLAEIEDIAPPALQFLPYREEYLKRCLLKIFHHPPRSTERQQDRLAALRECVAVICKGGNCSCLAYEAAVWLLEEEEEISGGQVSVGGQEVGGQKGLAAGVQTGAEGCIGLGRQATVAFAVENFSRRMYHQFPTNPTAQVLMTLMLRRHALLSKDPVPQPERRKWEDILEKAMAEDDNIDCASGFKALVELHYENRHYEKAHNCALRGLRWLQQRRDRGHEALTHVALGLRIILAKSLRRLHRLEEAERHFKALAGWVSEGELAFSEMCGSAPMSIHQQALRGIALVEMERGDHDAARSQYERILGKAALGRGPAEHWAHADYGWLLYQDGDLANARIHLEQAIAVTEEEGCSATDSQVGEHRYRLGEVYWSMGGEYASNKKYAFSQFLESAKVEGHAQGLALASLGQYYESIEKNNEAAQRCYKKALSIDPSVKLAGHKICNFLYINGRSVESIIDFCKVYLKRFPSALWAYQECGVWHLRQSRWNDALPFLLKATQVDAKSAKSWEYLGIVYYRLSRYSSSLRALEKSLSIDDTRFYPLILLGCIKSLFGKDEEAHRYFQKARAILPSHPAPAMEEAHALVRAAISHFQSGAIGTCESLLDIASALISGCLTRESRLVSAYKLMGDIHMLRKQVAPMRILKETSLYYCINKPNVMNERMKIYIKDQVMKSTLCYSKASHLCPWLAGAWRDLSTSLYHQCRDESTLSQGIANVYMSLCERTVGCAMRLQPESPENWRILAALYLNENDSKSHYSICRGLMLDKRDKWLWILLYQLSKRSGNDDACKYSLQQILQSHTDSGALVEYLLHERRTLDYSQVSDFPIWTLDWSNGLISTIQLGLENLDSRAQLFAAAQKLACIESFDAEMMIMFGMICIKFDDWYLALKSFFVAADDIKSKKELHKHAPQLKALITAALRATVQNEDLLPGWLKDVKLSSMEELENYIVYMRLPYEEVLNVTPADTQLQVECLIASLKGQADSDMQGWIHVLEALARWIRSCMYDSYPETLQSAIKYLCMVSRQIAQLSNAEDMDVILAALVESSPSQIFDVLLLRRSIEEQIPELSLDEGSKSKLAQPMTKSASKLKHQYPWLMTEPCLPPSLLRDAHHIFGSDDPISRIAMLYYTIYLAATGKSSERLAAAKFAEETAKEHPHMRDAQRIAHIVKQIGC